MKVLIISDAWRPQVNGVVRTLEQTRHYLQAWGHQVNVIGPDQFPSLPMPGYNTIPLALFPGRRLARMIKDLQPDTIHIATEGPLGLSARRFCVKNGLCFSTSYHTQFPEYLRLRLPIPLGFSYAFLRWFHRRAVCTMVSTDSQMRVLKDRSFSNLVKWSRGVDVRLFRPQDNAELSEDKPIFMYLGRVAVEKNIEAFLSLPLPGILYVVGDGPDRQRLEKQFPNARFVGVKKGQELVQHLSAADVFVFPSRTDTFGLVMLEAMACGVPVAAYPVIGPVDVVREGENGALDEDLYTAAMRALKVDRKKTRAAAQSYSWEAATRQFLNTLRSVSGERMGVSTEPDMQGHAGGLP
ncbi:MAG: glycosyltransferase family 1 protein [Gammaproteobacteria bacterium]|nr:glycosyltransferase family 1 protein [Gammaproteobacteria bacterium]